MLSDKVKKQIKKLALKNVNEEICGFIVKDKVIPCENVAEEDKKTNFEIANIDFLKYKLGEIQYIYHSHPSLENGSESFSEVDKVIAEKSKIPFLLYSIKTDKFLEYRPSGKEIAYINRPQILGILDCVTLVEDYFCREFGIIIAPVVHKDRNNRNKHKISYNKKTYRFLEKFYEKQNFRKVDNLQKNDIILMRTFGIKCAIHVGIYLGNGQFLHHPNTGSRIDTYNQFYKNRTVQIMRHANF